MILVDRIGRRLAALLLSLCGCGVLSPAWASAEPNADLQCVDATADALIRRGEYQQAQADLESRLRTADPSVASTLPLLASQIEVSLALHDIPAASVMSAALSVGSLADGDIACQARSLWAEIQLATKRGDVEAARSGARRALALLGPAGANTRLAARIHRALGNAERWAGDGPKAIESHERALAIWQAQHDEWGEAGESVNLAIAYSSLGEIGRAIDLSERARVISERSKDREGLAAAMSNLGAFYFVLGQNQRAVTWLRQSLDLHRQLSNSASQISDQIDLGELAVGMGELDVATGYFAAAEADLNPERDWQEQAHILIGSADIALRRGSYEKATQLSEQCRTLAGTRHLRAIEGSCELRLSQALHEQGQVETGLEHSHRALLIAEELHDSDLLWVVANILRLQLSRIDRIPEAIFFGKLAVNTLQKIRQGAASLPELDQQSLVQDRRWAHAQLADLLIGAGRIAEAQQVLMLMKRQELFDYLRGDSHTPTAEVPLDYVGQEPAWFAGYRHLADLLPSANGSPTNDDDFLAFLRHLDSGTTKPPSTDKSGVAVANDAHELWPQRLGNADRGTVLVQYLITEHRLRILVTTPQEHWARTVEIEPAALATQVSSFLQAVSDPASDPLPAAQAAYRLLIGPIAADLQRAGAKTLWLSLDGALRYVPFAALHDGQGWLMQRYATAVMSEAIGVPQPDRVAHAPHLAGLGMSQADGDFQALSYVPRELAAIVRPTSGSDTQSGVLPGKILLDDRFSGAALATTFGENYPLVHIATHFRLRSGSDADSFLLLGDRTHLSVKAFREAPYRLDGVDLLTLSACQTALNGSGNELEGFAAVAQLKGAHSVMASLWSVSDAGTQVLMRRFYERLQATGMNRALALAQSQRSLLMPAAIPAAGPGDSAARRLLAHPFIWAPFVLIGAPR